MNHKLAVSALLAGLAPAAQAQLQVYGLLDAGIEVVNRARADGSGAVRVVSGAKNAGRWGLRGSETLQPGVHLVYCVEGALQVDTGNPDGAPFRRQAFVGVEGKAGRLIAGRAFTTLYDFVIRFDPMVLASSYSWATSSTATAPGRYGMSSSFDNLVKYAGSSGPFAYGATLALGEQAGSAADGRKLAAAASWQRAGVGLMGAWERSNGTTLAATGRRDASRVWFLAGELRHGAWRYSLGMRGYALAPGTLAPPQSARTYWAGIGRTVGATTVTAALYHLDVRQLAPGQDPDPTMLALRGVQALSSRTDAYLAAAHARARHGKPTGLSRDEPGFGATQHGLTAGIQHRF